MNLVKSFTATSVDHLRRTEDAKLRRRTRPDTIGPKYGVLGSAHFALASSFFGLGFIMRVAFRTIM